MLSFYSKKQQTFINARIQYTRVVIGEASKAFITLL